MVEVARIVEDEGVPHVLVEVDAVEVVVPDAALRDHEEAEELVGQDHLHLLVHLLRVAGRVRTRDRRRILFVGFCPVKAILSKFVQGKRARTSSEGACKHCGSLNVPLSSVIDEDLSKPIGIEGRQSMGFRRLSMNNS